MTPALDAPASSLLSPLADILAAIRVRHGDAPVVSLVLGPITDPTGWTPATALTSGSAVADLLDAATQRWQAQPHVAAALAWKCYTYWVPLAAVLGYAAGRRMPLMHPDNVVVRFGPHKPFLTVGLRRVELAVRADDPLATGGVPNAHAAPEAHAGPEIHVVPDDAALLGVVRESLVDAHLALLMERIQEHAHVGSRTLWGSLASGVAIALSRAGDALPGPAIKTADALLDALGVANLVELRVAPNGTLVVQRRTCCLAFTLPQPKICSGCCIRSI